PPKTSNTSVDAASRSGAIKRPRRTKFTLASAAVQRSRTPPLRPLDHHRTRGAPDRDYRDRPVRSSLSRAVAALHPRRPRPPPSAEAGREGLRQSPEPPSQAPRGGGSENHRAGISQSKRSATRAPRHPPRRAVRGLKCPCGTRASRADSSCEGVRRRQREPPREGALRRCA